MVAMSMVADHQFRSRTRNYCSGAATPFDLVLQQLVVAHVKVRLIGSYRIGSFYQSIVYLDLKAVTSHWNTADLVEEGKDGCYRCCIDAEVESVHTRHQLRRRHPRIHYHFHKDLEAMGVRILCLRRRYLVGSLVHNLALPFLVLQLERRLCTLSHFDYKHYGSGRIDHWEHPYIHCHQQLVLGASHMDLSPVRLRDSGVR